MEILLFDTYLLPEGLFANKLLKVKISVSVVGVLASVHADMASAGGS